MLNHIAIIYQINMLSTSVTLLLVLPAILAAPKSNFQFKDCGPDSAVVRFLDVAVTPDPISFDKDAYSTMVFAIFEQLPKDASFTIDTWRGNRMSNQLTDETRVPCLFGASCEFQICEWMEWEYQSCMNYHNSTEYCSCPVKAGIRSDIMESFKIESNTFPSWFTEDIYTSKINIYDASRHSLGCLLVSGAVKK